MWRCMSMHGPRSFDLLLFPTRGSMQKLSQAKPSSFCHPWNRRVTSKQKGLKPISVWKTKHLKQPEKITHVFLKCHDFWYLDWWLTADDGVFIASVFVIMGCLPRQGKPCNESREMNINPFIPDFISNYIKQIFSNILFLFNVKLNLVKSYISLYDSNEQHTAWRG